MKAWKYEDMRCVQGLFFLSSKSEGTEYQKLTKSQLK
jgi:hypothetical protein